MPINELEKHPFLDSIDDRSFGSDYFDGLIIGSFPVYAITNTILPNGQEVERFDEAAAYMKYFYGSNQNSFWWLLSQCLGVLQNPAEIFPFENRVQAAKNLLTKHKLLITDSLYKTNRQGVDAQDSALMVPSEAEFVNQNKSLNYGIDALLGRNQKIKYLYFTSTVLIGKSPFGWFRMIFGDRLQWNLLNEVGGRAVSAELIIDSRNYVAFFLPSPAGDGMRGLQFTDDRRTQLLVNYIQSVDSDFYAEINTIPKPQRTQLQKDRLTQLRKDLLLESWRQAIVERNLGFDGDV